MLATYLSTGKQASHKLGTQSWDKARGHDDKGLYVLPMARYVHNMHPSSIHLSGVQGERMMSEIFESPNNFSSKTDHYLNGHGVGFKLFSFMELDLNCLNYFYFIFY